MPGSFVAGEGEIEVTVGINKSAKGHAGPHYQSWHHWPAQPRY